MKEGERERGGLGDIGRERARSRESAIERATIKRESKREQYREIENKSEI